MAHRAGHGQIQPHRHVGQRGKQGDELRAGGRVALDARITLLEIERAGKHQRLLAGEHVRQKAFEDHHGLGMDGPAELGFAFQVDDAFMPHAHRTGDAVRQAELEIPVQGDRKPVDLPDGRTGGTDLDHLAVVFLHEDVFHQIDPVGARGVGTFKDLSAHPCPCLPCGPGRRPRSSAPARAGT